MERVEKPVKDPYFPDFELLGIRDFFKCEQAKRVKRYEIIEDELEILSLLEDRRQLVKERQEKLRRVIRADNHGRTYEEGTDNQIIGLICDCGEEIDALRATQTERLQETKAKDILAKLDSSRVYQSIRRNYIKEPSLFELAVYGRREGKW